MTGEVIDMETLIDADAVAKWLSVKKSWVYYAAREGILPSVPLGKYVRFEPQRIREWIAQGGSADSNEYGIEISE